MRLVTSVALLASLVMLGCGDDMFDQPPPNQLAPESPTIDSPFGSDSDDDEQPATVGYAHGAGCSADSECAGGVCLMGEGFAGGYCTVECQNNADCVPFDGLCVDDSGSSYCAQSCVDQAECRNGYECTTSGGSAALACLPDRPRVDGEACATDSDCLGGFCITGGDWPDGYCTTLDCENRRDCASEGVDNRCLIQGRGGTNFCVRMCEDDSGCRVGYICEEIGGGQAYCSPSPFQPVDIEVDSYPFDIVCGAKPDISGTLEFEYEISSDTVAYMVTPFALDGQWLSPRQIDLPSGGTIDFSGANYFQTIPSEIFGFLNPTVVPAIPRFTRQLESGTHRYVLESDSEDVCHYVLQENTLGGVIDLNIFLVGVPDLDAEDAADDANMTAVLDTVETIYAQAGIELGDVRFANVNEDTITRYSIVRSESDVAGLVAETDTPEDGILSANIFFVEALAFYDGSGAIGISTGLPGPAGLHGTRASGVVFTSEFLGQEFEESSGQVVDGNVYTGVVFAHELGHYLGLFHTSEQWGMGHDPLDDTPECRDFNSGCSDLTNLMFPFAGIDHTVVTEDQSWVIAVNPLTIDGGQGL